MTLIAICVLAVVCILLFFIVHDFKNKCDEYRDVKENAEKTLETYRQIYAAEIEKRKEYEKESEDISSGSDDSFLASMDFLQKLNQEGNNRS